MSKRMKFLVAAFYCHSHRSVVYPSCFLWTYGFGSASAEPLISDSYEALPVWKTHDSKIARSIMETNQYAADSLGHFILDMPKESREQSIIVATGDHNTRTIFEYPDSSLLNHQFGGSSFLFDSEGLAAGKPRYPKVGRTL